jgi:hypothetical protein
MVRVLPLKAVLAYDIGMANTPGNYAIECSCTRYMEGKDEGDLECEVLDHVFQHFEDFQDSKVTLKAVKLKSPQAPVAQDEHETIA